MLYTSKIQTAAFMKALCLAVLFALAAGAPVAAGQGLCAADMRLTAGEDFLGFAGKGEVTIFEVDVPSAGYLAVEAVAPIDAPAEPKLALFDHGCAPATAGVKGVRIVERFVSGMVLKVRRPGGYFFAVAAQDPLTSLEFELVTRFVSRYAVDMVGDEEPDPDMVGDEEPDPDMVGDEEPDPDMIGTGLETKMASDLAGSLKPFVLCRSAEAKPMTDSAVPPPRFGVPCSGLVPSGSSFRSNGQWLSRRLAMSMSSPDFMTTVGTAWRWTTERLSGSSRRSAQVSTSFGSRIKARGSPLR